MTASEAHAIVAALVAAYRMDVSPETATIYSRALEPFDAREVGSAVTRVIETEERFPSIARIRREIGERRRLDLPTPISAWELVVAAASSDRRVAMPDEVREACDAIGGRWAVKTHDQPSILRSQFLKAYEELRAEAISRATEQAAKALPAAQPGKEIA